MTAASIVVPHQWRTVARSMVAVTGLAIAAGLTWAPARTWPNLLLADVYLLSIALGGAVLLSIHYLSGAGWSVVLRRIAEAMMTVLPVAAVLMLGVALGRRALYPWAQPDAANEWEVSASKAAYLSAPWVFARMALVLGAWVWLVRRLRRTSLEQDREAAPALHQRLVASSAIFAVVFPVTFALGSIDWLMSLDPRWTSTIYAVYVFAGLLVSGLAALTLTAILLRALGPMQRIIQASHLHDLGKLLLTFSTLWAYIWLSQYLLIWYGNLPDEITYYVRRTQGAWMWLFLLNLLMNWVVPFLTLLSREAKRNVRVLTAVCVLLLIGHWLDLYLLIMPDLWSAPVAGPLEALVPLGYAALCALLVARGLAQAPLVPLNDPYLDESLNHET